MIGIADLRIASALDELGRDEARPLLAVRARRLLAVLRQHRPDLRA